MTLPSPENRVLLQALRVGPDASDPPPCDDFDWPLLLDRATRHEVLPLLSRYVQSTYGDAVPADARAKLRVVTQAIAQRNLALTRELVTIVSALDREGITVLPYKGVLLALAAYDSLALRPFGDLDLFVARADVPRAIRVLLDLSFDVFPKLSPAQRRQFQDSECECWFGRENRSASVEVHWAVRERAFRFPLTVEQLAGRSRSITVGGRTMAEIRPEDQLPVLAIHGLKHGWDRLKWVRDIAGLLARNPEADWELVLAEARRLRASRVMRIPLLLAHDLLGAPLPGMVLDDARSDRGAVQLAAELGARLLTRVPAESEHEVDARLYLRARPGLTERAAFCAALMFQPTLADWEAVRLPDALFPLYYLVRPGRLVAKYAGRLI